MDKECKISMSVSVGGGMMCSFLFIHVHVGLHCLKHIFYSFCSVNKMSIIYALLILVLFLSK